MTNKIGIKVRNYRIRITAVGENEDGHSFLELELRRGRCKPVSKRFELGKVGNDLSQIYGFFQERALFLDAAEKRAFSALMRKLPDATQKIATQSGWHGWTYISPRAIHGPAAKSTRRYFPSDTEKWGTASSLKKWKAYAKEILPGNHLLSLLAAAAFAGPLLKVLNHPSIGFMLVGPTSTGKSTAERHIGSIWGGAPNRHLGFCESPRKTANAVEKVFRRHADGFLPFDDTKAIEPRARADWLSQITFMLEQGATKERLTDGTLPFHGRVIYLLSSNDSLSAIFGANGTPFDDSYRVRLIELPVPAGRGMFDRLPENMSPYEFCKLLQGATTAAYGTPIDSFLACLTRDLQRKPDELAKELGAWVDQITTRLSPNAADGPR
jgi:putative DNA primase/helicase